MSNLKGERIKKGKRGADYVSSNFIRFYLWLSLISIEPVMWCLDMFKSSSKYLGYGQRPSMGLEELYSPIDTYSGHMFFFFLKQQILYSTS